MALADLFPDGDYRFHLTLRRSDPRDFFCAQDPTGAVLAERARWLAADPARYAALPSEADLLLAEFGVQCVEWGIGHPTTAVELGAMLEPDVLFLSPDAAGDFRLRGGALCFPTGWALEEKLGLPVESIHGAVPGLNPALAASIRQFLGKLKPGVVFCRDNWGLAASAELNLHPARAVPAPAPPVVLDRLWLRVEHQALMALPQTGGIVFGIRIALHRLDVLAATDSAATAGLRRALVTMPETMLRYKRLNTVRDDIVRQLAEATGPA